MNKNREHLVVDHLQRQSVTILMVLAILAALKIGASFLAPLGIAVFLVALAWPVKTLLNRFLPESLSYIGSFLALLLVIVVVGGAIYLSTQEIVEKAPQYQQGITESWRQIKNRLALNGVNTASSMPMQEVGNVAGQLLSNIQNVLLTFLLVIAYVALALPEIGSWKNKIRTCFAGGQSNTLLCAFEQTGKSFQAYMVAMVICGIISAVATFVVVSLLGLDFVFTWSVLAFILSFIPVVGAFLTVIPPALLSVFQFDGYTMPLMVLLALGGTHAIIGNLVEPKIQGNMLSMSPLVVLISLSLWSFLWGLPGALLAAPFTHGIIIAFRQYKRTQWLSCLLSQSKG